MQNITNDSSSSSDNSDSSESEEDMIPQHTLTTTVSQNTRSASDSKRRSLYEAAKNDLEDGILSKPIEIAPTASFFFYIQTL